MEIQKLYDKMDTQLKAERHDISSHVSNLETKIIKIRQPYFVNYLTKYLF